MTTTDTTKRLRRIDALVAEHVMGWHQEYGYWKSADDPEGYIANYWRPSESWDAAGQVVERMRELGWDCDVSARVEWQYGCRLAPKGEFNTPAVQFVAADTAPLAICLAALRALGVNIGDVQEPE